MLKQLENTGRKHAEEGPVENAETLKVKIYAEGLESLTEQDEWHALFKESKELKLELASKAMAHVLSSTSAVEKSSVCT